MHTQMSGLVRACPWLRHLVAIYASAFTCKLVAICVSAFACKLVAICVFAFTRKQACGPVCVCLNL